MILNDLFFIFDFCVVLIWLYQKRLAFFFNGNHYHLQDF